MMQARARLPIARHLDWVVVISIVTVVALWPALLFRAGGYGESWGLTPRTSAILAIFSTLACVSFGVAIAYFRAILDVHQRHQALAVTSPDEHHKCGLGPLPAEATPSELYLDMVKRIATNIVYEDEPEFYYDRGKAVRADRFDLRRRVEGLDFPTKAHTMVGMRRLDNLQRCIETALGDKIEGDILESGVLCGGASIFARAVLKAYGVRDRRVYACDTFLPPTASPPVCLILLCSPLLWFAATIPFRWWKRKLCFFLMSLQKSFPQVKDPSDELVELVLDFLKYPRVTHKMPTSLDHVKSHFARYGLLDDQVVFVQGSFSKTLPSADIERLSVLRLDGDTYESTIDALDAMYPRLSPGGFCIVDDYCIPDCRQAIEDYRNRHGIADPIKTIDHAGAYWRKASEAAVDKLPSRSVANDTRVTLPGTERA